MKMWTWFNQIGINGVANTDDLYILYEIKKYKKTPTYTIASNYTIWATPWYHIETDLNWWHNLVLDWYRSRWNIANNDADNAEQEEKPTPTYTIKIKLWVEWTNNEFTIKDIETFWDFEDALRECESFISRNFKII